MDVDKVKSVLRNHTDVDKEKSKLDEGHSARMTTILLVDDVAGTRLMTKWFLDYAGFIVHAFSNAQDALACFNPKIHDLVVTDNSMAPMTGAEMAHIIKMRSPATPVLMYTGAAPRDQSCLDVVIQRPAPLPLLKEAIDKLLDARH